MEDQKFISWTTLNWLLLKLELLIIIIIIIVIIIINIIIIIIIVIIIIIIIIPQWCHCAPISSLSSFCQKFWNSGNKVE